SSSLSLPYTTLFRSLLRRERLWHLAQHVVAENMFGSIVAQQLGELVALILLPRDDIDARHFPFQDDSRALAAFGRERAPEQVLRSEEHTSELQSREN